MAIPGARRATRAALWSERPGGTGHTACVLYPALTGLAASAIPVPSEDDWPALIVLAVVCVVVAAWTYYYASMLG